MPKKLGPRCLRACPRAAPTRPAGAGRAYSNATQSWHGTARHHRLARKALVVKPGNRRRRPAPSGKSALARGEAPRSRAAAAESRVRGGPRPLWRFFERLDRPDLEDLRWFEHLRSGIDRHLHGAGWCQPPHRLSGQRHRPLKK